MGFLVIPTGFPIRYLKCSFHFWCLSSWLTAFSFAFKLFFLFFGSFTVCHIHRDCLSSTEFQISLIWYFPYSTCYLFRVCYLLLNKNNFRRINMCWVSFIKKICFFILSHFHPTLINSHGTLRLTFGFVGTVRNGYFSMGCNKVFILVTWSTSFRYLLKHIKLDLFYSYVVPSISFKTFFVQAFKIMVDSWTFTMLLRYILWDDWPIFMISGSNEQLQQQLEYTLLKTDCHRWWFSKMQSDPQRRIICTKIMF